MACYELNTSSMTTVAEWRVVTVLAEIFRGDYRIEIERFQVGRKVVVGNAVGTGDDGGERSAFQAPHHFCIRRESTHGAAHWAAATNLCWTTVMFDICRYPIE